MSDNAIIYKEAAQTAVAMVALTDSGDHKTFESADELWSGKSGFAPDVKPNGVATGGNLSPSVADNVAVSAATVYLAGVLTTVAADAELAVTRPDATHLLLTFAAAGYTSAVAGDIGKTVVGGTTSDSGTLVAYNNTTRQWIIDQVDSGDLFDDDDEAITITTGTGAGSLEGVGAVAAHLISSITVNSSGSLAVVAGIQGGAFSAIRGAIGGPPLIPVGSVELGWVRYSATASAIITTSEIRQILGESRETYNYPAWTENRMVVENGALGYAGVTFDAALPLIHTGGVPKAVYASYYTPEFAEIPETTDFKPPETTHSTSSTQIYGKVKGASSSTLGQGSFTAYLNDGISDSLVSDKNEVLFFKFKQNRLNTPYILCQGTLGISREFPANEGVSAACTISSTDAAVEVTS